MARYTIQMHWGERVEVEANLAEASAPICIVDDDGKPCSTPYQTADARHRVWEMARLVIGHMGPDWYADPSSARTDDEQLQTAIDLAEVA